MNEFLTGVIVGIVAGAATAFSWLKAEWKQTIQKNLSLRGNILDIRNFEDVRLAKEALLHSPIPSIRTAPAAPTASTEPEHE